MIIQYDGSRYNGWQKQGNTPDTIQEKLESLLTKQYGLPIEVAGSGRTDAGVHALAQSASFRVPQTADRFSPDELLSLANRYLPADIRVLSVYPAHDRFHARLSARRKCYEYRLDCGKIARVFDRKYVTRLEDCLPLLYGTTAVPSPVCLNIPAMKAAAAMATGTHDFKSFCGNRKMKKSTVRTIDSITIEETESGLLCIRCVGNGFLYHMVRILTGTLVEIGLGLSAPDSMEEIIQGKNRDLAGFTAPPQGLFLCWVEY